MKGTNGGSGGPDTVKHVGAKGYGDDEVFRVSNSHYIARFFGREPSCTRVDAGSY